MRIGIDISQIAFEGTGVARYVREIVKSLLTLDHENEYVLFGASLRKQESFRKYFNELTSLNKKISLVVVPTPPTLLDIIWNKLHILAIEHFTGPLDVFWSSDWTQPPLAKARGITTIHDVSFLKFPESFVKKIIEVQKRRLKWAKKECEFFLCDSKATANDVNELLSIKENQLKVVYPGFTL